MFGPVSAAGLIWHMLMDPGPGAVLAIRQQQLIIEGLEALLAKQQKSIDDLDKRCRAPAP